MGEQVLWEAPTQGERTLIRSWWWAQTGQTRPSYACEYDADIKAMHSCAWWCHEGGCPFCVSDYKDMVISFGV